MCSAELIFNILQTITQINLSSLCRENYRPANFARNIQKLNKQKKTTHIFLLRTIYCPKHLSNHSGAFYRKCCCGNKHWTKPSFAGATESVGHVRIFPHMSLITVIHALRAASKIFVTSNVTAVHSTAGNQEQNGINCDRWSLACHRFAVPNRAVSLRRLESCRPFFPTAIMKLPLWS